MESLPYVEPEDQGAARVLKDVLAWLSNDCEMQGDSERLVKVCCAPQLPTVLKAHRDQLVWFGRKPDFGLVFCAKEIDYR